MKILLILVFSLLMVGDTDRLPDPSKTSTTLKCDNLIKNGAANQKGKFWKKVGSGALSAVDGPSNFCFALWHGGALEGITQNVKITSDQYGQECMVSGWVKRQNASSERLGEPIIRVHFFDKNKSNIKSVVIGQGSQDTWELLSKSVIVPEGAVRMQMKLKLGNEGDKVGGNGQGYFDNLSISFCGEVTKAP